jgi:hypothetical protein
VSADIWYSARARTDAVPSVRRNPPHALEDHEGHAAWASSTRVRRLVASQSPSPCSLNGSGDQERSSGSNDPGRGNRGIDARGQSHDSRTDFHHGSPLPLPAQHVADVDVVECDPPLPARIARIAHCQRVADRQRRPVCGERAVHVPLPRVRVRDEVVAQGQLFVPHGDGRLVGDHSRQ